MLREGPILFDAVDRDAYVPRPELESALLRASRHGRGVLLTGPGGSGRSTSLNWIARTLADEGVNVARVDARPAGSAQDVLDLIDQALPVSSVRKPARPVPADASALVRLQESVRRLTRHDEVVILLDNLFGRDVIRPLFGGLRDLLWESGHRWVVTAHPSDRAQFLAAPADAFFMHRLEIPPLSDSEIQGFLARSAAHELELDSPAGRYPGPVVRALLHPEDRRLATGTKEELGEQAAAVMDHLIALNRPVAPDDDELVHRTGLSPTSLRRHLLRLRDEGYLSASPDTGGRPGRPRIMYEPSNRPVWE